MAAALFFLLVFILLAVAGGCVCVWRAARGDVPRWVRAWALATLVAGELVRKSGSRRTSSSGGGDSGDGGD
ncbi:hypothetical protein ACFUIW_35420 [Streptomyces sp. NPDC057245]|uniref:hypothetical protein n=1 Tax=Streptomyces TaxID=1883 RepID=UPI001C1DE4C0|nr:hypothetical protein [Streptomyces sp. A108]MBU6535425.1 hypothetical protein [Streptomyces sp. A108]